MSEGKKYLIGFQTGPYSARTQLLCDIEDIKVGDYVVAPAGLGDAAGRVMSVNIYVEGQNMSLKKVKKVTRRATAKEIAELEEIFGFKTGDEEELDPFEAALAKYSRKEGTGSEKQEDQLTDSSEPTSLTGPAKSGEEGMTSKLRFVLVILALLAYMYYDKLVALLE